MDGPRGLIQQQAPAAQTTEEVNAGMVSECTAYYFSGLVWQQKGDQDDIEKTVIMVYLISVMRSY